MDIDFSQVNTQKYFADPRVAEFADHIQKGNLAKVQAALRAGIGANAEGLQGFRPLFFIFPARTADVARELLKAGADPNARLNDGTPPLLFAVRMENSAFTQALLDFKADPNAVGPNEKPVIHEAVLADAPQNIKLLAKAGANINVVWGSGTPLYAAVSADCYACAATLLDLGADTEWRDMGPRLQLTAADNFCRSLARKRPTSTNRKPIQELFAAFARRHVKLACDADAARFR